MRFDRCPGIAVVDAIAKDQPQILDRRGYGAIVELDTLHRIEPAAGPVARDEMPHGTAGISRSGDYRCERVEHAHGGDVFDGVLHGGCHQPQLSGDELLLFGAAVERRRFGLTSRDGVLDCIEVAGTNE